MKILSTFRRYVSFACSLVALLGLATPALATHLRGGTVTWRVTGTTATTYTVQFTFIESSRWSYPGTAGSCGTVNQATGTCPALNASVDLTNQTGGTFTFGDGSAAADAIGIVTSINQAEDYMSATFVFSHTYAISAQPETAFFEACCRISTLKIEHDQEEYISTIVRNYTNGAPTAATPAILAVPLLSTTTFNIASVVSDIDPNATLVYRLATVAEQYGPGTTAENCVFISAPPGFTVSSTGQVTWNTALIATANCGLGAPAAGDLWTAQIMVEAHDKTTGTLITETPVDFLMKFVSPVGALPTLILNPAGTQTVAIGTPVAFTATANSSNANAKVTLNATGIPSGATATGLNAAVTPPTTSNFNWTPGPGQDGTYVVTYTVTDNNLQQATASNTIVVATLPTISCTTPLHITFGQTGTLTSTVFDINQDLLNVVWSVDGTTVQTNSNVTAYPNPATVQLQQTFGSAGVHAVKVTATDPHGVAVSCSTSVTVAQATTSLSALQAPSAGVVGGSLLVSTALTQVSAPSGPVIGAPIVFSFTLSGVTVSTLNGTTDVNGLASVNFEPPTSGLYTISASFAGNASLQSATALSASVPVYQRTSLALAPVSGTVAGASQTLTAFLTASPSSVPVAGQQVTFTFSGTGAPSPLTATTDVNGAATVQVVFPTAGSFTATASFFNLSGFFADPNGNLVADTASGSVTVALATTSLSTLSAPATTSIGNTLTVSTTLNRVSAPAGPVSGVPIIFAFTAPGGAVTTLSGTTDTNGLASATITPTVGGGYSVSAQFAGTGGLQPATSSSTSVTVYQRTSLGLSPASGTAGSTLTLNATLVAVPSGVPLANQTVTFSFSGTGAPGSTTAVTNANGVATAQVVFPTAGSFTATASFSNPGGFFADSNGNLVADAATAPVTVALATTSLSALNAPSAALVGGSLTVSTTLTRVSAPGGAVAGVPVIFTLTAPGGAVTTASGTTAANGLATATFTLTTSGVSNISAQFAGNGGLAAASSSSASVTVYQRTSLALAPANGTAGSAVTLSAILTAVPSGVPVANQTVTFSFSGPGAPSQTTATAVTDVNGVATASVVFPTAGTFTATASFFNAGGFFTDPTGAITPPIATLATAPVTVTIATTSLSALNAPSATLVGNTLTVSTTLNQVSAPAGPVAGVPIHFTLTAPGGAVTTASGTTAANGLATAAFTPTTSGVYSISAQFAGNGGLQAATSTSVSVTVYQRTSLGLTSASGTAGSTLTLNATLAAVPSGTPLANQTVTFSFSGPGAPGSTTVVTNANGVATAQLVFPTAGSFTATASFSNAGGFFTDSTGDVPAAATTANAPVTVVLATSSLSALQAPVAAFVGGPLTVSTTLTQVSAPGGPIAGVPIVFTLTGPGGAVTTVSGITAANGMATVIFTPTVAGLSNISAQFAGNGALTAASSNGSVTVYQRTSLALSPASGTAGSAVTLSATLTAVPSGVPVAGQTVTFTFTGTGAPSPVTATTGTNGVATASVVFPTAGTFTATAAFFNPVGFFADSTGAFPLIADTAGAQVTVAQAPPATITVTASGLVYSRVSQTYTGTVTLKNTGSSSVSGPFQILFTGLTANVTLVNATGTLAGTPYITVSAPASLAPGQSVVVSVQFADPSNATIHFTPLVQEGSI